VVFFCYSSNQPEKSGMSGFLTSSRVGVISFAFFQAAEGDFFYGFYYILF